MKPNTDLPLKFLPTEEIVRRFNNVETILLYETFGNDHEARHNAMKERAKLFQELKRRGCPRHKLSGETSNRASERSAVR